MILFCYFIIFISLVVLLITCYSCKKFYKSYFLFFGIYIVILILLIPFLYSVFNLGDSSYRLSFGITFFYEKINIINLKINKNMIFLSILVTSIFISAQFYSFVYLSEEKNQTKFFFFLSLFSISMIFIFLSNNLILTFIF